MDIHILGYGVTNQAIVGLLNNHGVRCIIYDDKYTNGDTDSEGNTYYTLQHTQTLLHNNPKGELRLAIISPGIPPNSPCLRYFRNIISEYDFIFFFAPKLYSIWISGTNGKTTTTEMTSRMLGAKSGGNIGVPLGRLFMQDYSQSTLDLRALNEWNTQSNKGVYGVVDWEDSQSAWVLETSSFALHYTNFALPNIYILLPLSQDHISWHGSFESYIEDKLKPLMLMNKAANPKQHYALIPKDLLEFPHAKKIIQSAQAQVLLYADSRELEAYLQLEAQYCDCFKEPFLLDFMLAASGMRFGGIPFQMDRILSYRVGAYRMEEIWHNKLLFINDSKATNPHAALSALQTYQNHAIYLILGGDAKGASLSMLYPFLKAHGVLVFSIGRDGAMIAKECGQHGISVQECGTLAQAMKSIAHAIRKDYDVGKSFVDCESFQRDSLSGQAPIVMLSPACASLDQYNSYQQRGDEFKSLIHQFFA